LPTKAVRGEADLARGAVRDDVDRAEAAPAGEPVGDLRQGAALGTQHNGLDLGPQALQKRAEIRDAWVDEGEFGNRGNVLPHPSLPAAAVKAHGLFNFLPAADATGSPDRWS
jgi:hypothetical protein